MKFTLVEDVEKEYHKAYCKALDNGKRFPPKAEFLKALQCQHTLQEVVDWLDRHIISVKTDLDRPFGKQFMLQELKKQAGV